MSCRTRLILPVARCISRASLSVNPPGLLSQLNSLQTRGRTSYTMHSHESESHGHIRSTACAPPRGSWGLIPCARAHRAIVAASPGRSGRNLLQHSPHPLHSRPADTKSVTSLLSDAIASAADRAASPYAGTAIFPCTMQAIPLRSEIHFLSGIAARPDATDGAACRLGRYAQRRCGIGHRCT